MLNRIGILGGTFNPVHQGHIQLAKDALKQFSLDRVIFVPCARPPHKSPDRLAPAKHRIAMLKAAIGRSKRFDVSDIEVRRGGTSYSIDTLMQMKRKYPDVEFHFIIGWDSIGELTSWKRIDELRKLCTFVAMGRPGYRMLRSPGVKIFKGRQVDASSSDIRKRIGEGKGIRRLVPAAVARYIAANRLYKVKESRRSKRSS